MKKVNWPLFEAKIKEKKLLPFTPLDIRRVFDLSKESTSKLLYRYTKKEFIIRLKKGLYVLKDANLPDIYVANKLYGPSYVSLEFALSYHQVIPESVYQITSVTPKPTRRINALGKIFTYRRIKRQAFTGYTAEKQRSFSFLIAEPEKALVDLNYLRVLKGKKPLSRFDKDKINSPKALKYARLFENDKLIKIIKTTLK